MLRTYHTRVFSLETAWLETMRAIMDTGREYRKDGGSRAGLLRRSLDFVTVEITHPETRPLVPVASRPGLISPCSEAEAEEYLAKYLYNTEAPADNESYTYAVFLTPQVHATARHFARFGLYCQQAIMQVGTPFDVGGYMDGDDGYSIPCLRLVDCRIIDLYGPKLCYYIYFRAWNHFGAMPMNLAGLQMLKELHAEIINSELWKLEKDPVVQPGPTFIMSKDLHINEIEWDAANAWLGR